ncbi:MAG: response regulator [Elusimicrobia bacterium]|nr:response regulator [Elusimicrobiota bacterium]
MTDEPIFTTFSAAKACGVFHTTVTNWVNKGKLKAYTTPGGHRRIRLSDLLEFMDRFDMPVPEGLRERACRVLIVEDDPTTQRIFQRAVQGYDVACCASGLEALIAIGKDAPDLLILDVNIPEVNGLDVCKLLRSVEQTRPIKILAITGAVLSAADERFLKANSDGFLRKPVKIDEIREAVDAIMEPESEKAARR